MTTTTAKDVPMPPPEEQEMKEPSTEKGKEDVLMEETEESKAKTTNSEPNNNSKELDAAAVDATTTLTTTKPTSTDTVGYRSAPMSSSSLPPKPIKRARTAYFIFADEKRAEITARHPGEGVGAIARETGQLWSALTEEQKVVYQQQSTREKEQVAKALEEYSKAMPDSAILDKNGTTTGSADSKNNKGTATALALPSARIRKIAKLDPEVKGISKEALLLITKSAELFTTRLGLETVKVAALQNRRKLLPHDVAHVCAQREQFLFLKNDMADLEQQQQQEAAAAKQAKHNAKVAAAAAAAAAAANQDNNDNSNSSTGNAAKPLTDYFASVNKNNNNQTNSSSTSITN